MKRMVAVALLLSGLAGCSWLYSEQTIEPITDPEISVVKDWMVQAGTGSKQGSLKLEPAAADGKIITTDERGTLTAIDADTGGLVWQVHLDKPVSSGPAVGDNKVFVGTLDAEVIALDIDSGKEVWSKPVSNQVLAAPSYSHGLVFAKTVNGELVALDANTGEKRWDYFENLPRLVLRGGSSPQPAHPFVVTGFADGKMVVLTAQDGKLVWEAPVAHPEGFSDLSRMVDIQANPVIVNDVIYAVSYQGRLIAVNLRSGELLWHEKISSYSGLTVTDKAVYVTDVDGQVWSLDRHTGTVNWRQTDLIDRGLTAPAAIGNYLAVADAEGYIHWLDQTDGHFVSRQFFMTAGVNAAPFEYRDKIYVFARNGALVALQPKKD